MTTPDLAYLAPIALAAEIDGASQWVELVPPGPEIVANDGRRFRLDDPQAVVAAFPTAGRGLPVDVEHATQQRAEKGLDAPAYGWIKEVEVRGGGIWGLVEWGEQARQWLADKSYRFISPAFRAVRETGEIRRLVSAGLTNTPAFTMTALARAGATEETKMSKAIAQALKLPETASEAEIVMAIASLQEREATARAADPDPARFVPIAELQAATAKIAEFEAADTAREDAAAEAAVDAAIVAGKGTPASRKHLIATCKAIGLEAFAELVGGMAERAGKSGLNNDAPTKGAGAAGLTADELAVCRLKGTDPEVFAAFKKEDA